MARLWELATLAVLLVLIGALIVTPAIPLEARAGAISAIVGAMLLLARIRRR